MIKLHDNYEATTAVGPATSGANKTQQQTPQLQIGAHQDPGITRKNKPNEDTLFITQSTWPLMNSTAIATSTSLMLVADGMGGLGHGREASRLAARTLYNYLSQVLTAQQGTEENILSILSAGVQCANQALYARNRAQMAMGTTMTVALLAGSTAYVAHVGDGRLYRYRQGSGLTQLTHDHSLVALLVERGAISRDDMYTHPRRNEIYRSLGNERVVEVDTFSVALEPGDLLLACSDGLWEMVRDAQIASILTTPVPTPCDTAHALVQAALVNGGKDNVSVIVTRVIREK